MRHHLLAALAAAGLMLSAGAASADTVGNAPVARGMIDTCLNGCNYIVNQAFTEVGAHVTSYSLFAIDQTDNYGDLGDITPLLFTRSDPDAFDATFTLVGIGTNRSGVTGGLHTFDFGLVDGTDLVGANTYFGFRNEVLSLVEFDYIDGPGPSTFLTDQLHNIGDSFTLESTDALGDTQNALNGRAYSIQATASVPEPATWALMLTGFGGLGAMLRTRRRALLAA